ncbi:hypothetical protein AVEN_240661-1 [Araneus ventricosus]|uniref:Reverse transcriptase domain-containing protein n=1 Tax=Araneus ventricosus TaxID=182803 RepID=A0A4Y2D492_ARAVE|nr:hypothetical protein AVEN_240661-1 [Araneus ventricosus]
MINARLVYELEINGCISPYQSGFRKGRSTTDNIAFLESQIRNAFVKRNHLVSIFFDLEKAYDRTWRYGILRALSDFGFRGHLPTFIQQFLSFRHFRVRVGTTLSGTFIQSEGVPQGSVLNFLQGSDIYRIQRQLQSAINDLVGWCEQNGHTISAVKSSCVHFCRKRSLHPDPTLYVHNQSIPVVNGKSALEALSHPQNGTHPLALDILCLLQTLQARDFQILFCWLPGHVGIKGNELADTAAKTATTSWQQPLPYADVKKFVSHHIHNLWQGSWDLQISNKLHSIKPRITLWPALPRSIGFGLFNKRVHTKKDNSGPEDTAYHAAQQRKAITGSGKPQPLRLPCMLARIYTLVVTPWDSDHP